MSTTITMTLTVAQAQALEWIVAYGIDENEYVLNSPLAHGYSANEAAEQHADVAHASEAHGVLQGALRQAGA